MGLSIALREWSAVVDALGHGTQTVMVRSFIPKSPRFFLYPTYSFYTSAKTRPQCFDEKFQPQYLDKARISAEKTLLRAHDLLVDFNYYAEFDDAVSVEDQSAWKRLEPFYIWSFDHIRQYATSTAFVWIVRVYRLPQTLVISRKPGGGPPTFYNHSNELCIEGSAPVLTDTQFEQMRSQIISATAPLKPKSRSL